MTDYSAGFFSSFSLMYSSSTTTLFIFGKYLKTASTKTDLFTKLSQWFGLQISKSSLEGGGRHALLTLIDELKRGKPVLIPADGPRGPEKKFKTSALIVAQQTAASIVPITWKSEWSTQWPMKCGVLNLPLPFSSIEIRLGSQIQVSAHDRLEELDRLKTQIAEALDRLMDKESV